MKIDNCEIEKIIEFAIMKAKKAELLQHQYPNGEKDNKINENIGYAKGVYDTFAELGYESELLSELLFLV